MKILSIGGLKIAHDAVKLARYSSDESLLDYDMVIWDPTTLLGEYKKTNVSGREYLATAQVIYDIKRRNHELEQFVKLGRTLVVILPKPYSINIWRSGVGNSEMASRIYDHIPIEGLKPFPADGDSIEFRGNEPLKTYWERMCQFHCYSAYLESKVGNPFLFVKGTDKVVGTCIRNQNGFSLILPGLTNPFRTMTGFNEMCTTFIDSLVELINNLKNADGDFKLPDWVGQYSLPGENESKEKLEGLENTRKEIVHQIQNQSEVLSRIQSDKVLIAGTGKPLERQVIKVFEELGLEVTPGDSQRDDLLIKYNGIVAEVEVKGVKRSATESHARQLEAWVQDYTIKNGGECKGILIVNAFCDTPLEHRHEPSFPHPVKVFSEKRDHCLITTTQLLGLYLRCISNPEEKESLIRGLFSTIGEYPMFDDYKKFLSSVETG